MQPKLVCLDPDRFSRVRTMPVRKLKAIPVYWNSF